MNIKRFFITKTILLSITIFLSSNMHGEDNQKSQIATPEQIESSWFNLNPSDVPESFRTLFQKYLPLLTGPYNLAVNLAKQFEEDRPKLLEALQSIINLTYTHYRELNKRAIEFVQNQITNHLDIIRVVGIMSSLLSLVINTNAFGYIKDLPIMSSSNIQYVAPTIAGREIPAGLLENLGKISSFGSAYWIYLELYKWLVIDKAIERAYEQLKDLVSSPSIQS